ncbi:Beta-galactoside-binding lectin [Labeo rohita]|uniref:Galectin n=1 Tax=Labeo rohita TaxID=84645 RepID=A0A498N1I5_LABRO|nr:Beta-galactoside-binding lectin [Labeo rohita]RXN26621.1 Beta-galactoside-binding lectin [Labeo rohita]
MSGVLVQNMSFKAGQTLALTGVPNADSTNFAINIGHSAEDIALHMNPRFDAHGDQRTVVCNSFQDGNWCEEVREGSFPFNQNEEFQARLLKITFTNEEFLVTLPDGSQFHFPNRQGAEKYKYMHFEGELKITFTNEEFLVTLPDGSQFHFPNCQGAEKYKYMHFEGERATTLHCAF